MKILKFLAGAAILLCSLQIQAGRLWGARNKVHVLDAPEARGSSPRRRPSRVSHVPLGGDEELPGSLSTRSMHTPPLPHGGAGSGDAVIELPRRPTRSPRLSPRRRVEEELDAVYGARDASSAQLQAVQSRIDELSVSDDGEMQRRELARVVQGHKKRHEAYDEVIAASAAERARIIAEEARAKGSGPASSRRPRRRSSGSAGFDALPFPGALPEEARAAVEDPVEPRDILAAV